MSYRQIPNLRSKNCVDGTGCGTDLNQKELVQPKTSFDIRFSYVSKTTNFAAFFWATQRCLISKILTR